MGRDDLDMDLVRAGCLLHDIGVYRLQPAEHYVRHGLLGHELRIDAALAHQGGMLAFFGDMSTVEDEDAIAIDDARQAVRQDERRAALHQPVERFLDHRLVLGIDGRQRLVEDAALLVVDHRIAIAVQDQGWGHYAVDMADR